MGTSRVAVFLVLGFVLSAAAATELGQAFKNSFDPGVQGIRLMSSDSTRRVLGNSPEKEFPGALLEHKNLPGRRWRFTADGHDSVLTLYHQPGSERLSVSQAQVTQGANGYPVFPGSPKRFETARGIRLGMSRQDVIERLGEPQKRGADVLIYKMTRENAAQLLNEYNMPIYEAVYRFRDGDLTSFKFGFPVP